MIAGVAVDPHFAAARRRLGLRHRSRPVPPAVRRPLTWHGFRSDRQAVRLKLIALALMLLAAGLLEGRW